MTVQVIDRELYTIPEAARILRMPASTLRWWLEGKRGHQPVIRLDPTGRVARRGEVVPELRQRGHSRTNSAQACGQ